MGTILKHIAQILYVSPRRSLDTMPIRELQATMRRLCMSDVGTPDPSVGPINSPHRCSFICALWKLGSCRPCLLVSHSGRRCVHISGASKVISCFRVAGEPLSQPRLSVCWGTSGSPNAISTQCVWASPLATLAWTGVGWRGYPNRSFSVCLSAAPLSLSHVHSLHLPLNLSATSLVLSKQFAIALLLIHSSRRSDSFSCCNLIISSFFRESKNQSPRC